MSAAWLILISLVLNRCRVNGFGKETGGIICSANSAGNGNSLNLTLLASNNFSNAGLISGTLTPFNPKYSQG